MFIDPQTMQGTAGAASSRPSMSGAAMVWAALVEHQTDLVFGYPGGSILPVYNLLRGQNGIRHILPRHEQAGAFAATAYAKASGKTGVLIVTSGPGATNTVTGLAEAYADSIPLVMIAGQVPTALIGSRAFQESDITGMTRPCTKASWLVRDSADLPFLLHEAFRVASSGRKGPVVIDLPKDIQLAQGDYISRAAYGALFVPPASPPQRLDIAALEQAVVMMKKAKKPVLYIGGGITAAGQDAANELHKLADATGFPVTSTLMGLGCLPASHKQGLGMLGMYGTLEANKAMHEADLIVAIGARFDDRATGPAGLFAPEAKIVHIDIDPQPIGGASGRRPDLTIKAESGAALRSLNEAWGKGRGVSLSLQPWWQKIEGWRAQQCLSFAQQKGQIMPQQAIRTLSRLTQGWDATIVTGVGQHQMWTAQHYGFEQAGRLITSGGHGSMGYCLPAAIGAQLARPNAAVICVTGDGSFQMNAQEMITATAYGLPIKVLLLNNGKLGMVRQIMKDDYGQPLAETDIGIQPDFAALAKANGWQAGRVRSPSGLTRALSRLLAAKGPALLDCRTAPEEMCYPVIPTGKSHAVIKHNGTRVSP